MHPVQQPKLPAIELICRRYHVRRLEVFGSIAADDFDLASSDVDFVVEFQPLQPGEYADVYFGLLAELRDLLGRPVDLIVDRAIQNPYFREIVDEAKVPIYAAGQP
jgi:uncharacterized protein